MGRDQRSPEAATYRKLYSTAEWRNARASQLQAHPLCERCAAADFIVAATVVNHRRAHKGDRHLFFDPTNHQSVCAPCHDQAIQSDERTGVATAKVGYRGDVGADGWPTDPRHRANRPR